MIIGAYCVGTVHNMLPLQYKDNGAYCVGRVHNMLPRQYYNIGSILCRLGTQYATLAAFR